METLNLFPFIAPVAPSAAPVTVAPARVIPLYPLPAPAIAQRPPEAQPVSPAATERAAFPAGDLDAMIERAEGTLTRVLQSGRPVCVSWSAGKDSSVVLNLLLSAAAKLALTGAKLPPLVVVHADTLTENPSMVQYAHGEMEQVRAFALAHGLDVTIEVSTPNLAQQWAVRVIGGRALPSFPGQNRTAHRNSRSCR